MPEALAAALLAQLIQALADAHSAQRITLTIPEAATALAVSEDTFRRYVLPDLRVIQASPRIVVVRVAELQRWAERHEHAFAS